MNRMILSQSLQGEELVTISRRDYDRLLALAEPAAVARRAIDRALADPARYPADVVDMVLGGSSPLQAWRRYRGLSQAALAAQAGLTQSGVASIERRGSMGRRATRERLAAALDVPVSALDPLD